MKERRICQHRNCVIIEDVMHRYTYTFLDGSYADNAAYCGPLPQIFHVKCRDCELDKTYRYAPGVFGPWSKPSWLYDRIEATKNVAERFPRPKRRGKPAFFEKP